MADLVSGRVASATASAAATMIGRLKRAVHEARLFMAYPTNGASDLWRFSMKTIPV
jgi:hypothetical protein